AGVAYQRYGYDGRMRLAQAWRRGGFGAAAVTFVVPGALAVAIVVVALSGGLRGLGAVGQVLTGPEVPEAAKTSARVPASRAPARLPTVPRAPAPALFAPAVAAPAPAAGVPAPPVTTRPVGTVPPPRGGVVPVGSAPAAGGAPASPTPSGGPQD